MVRKFPKHIFLTSLAITVVVFVAGLMLGFGLDNLRTSSILEGLQDNELDAESFVIEQNFWEVVADEDSCEVAEARLNSLSIELVELGNYLTSYQQKSLFKEDEFNYLARWYFLLEIEGYVLYHDIKRSCEVSNDVILYFYDPEDSDSENQGFTLDRLVERGNGTVDVFSINAEFEGDSAIDTLLVYYEIEETPTLIINGETKQVGYTSFSEIAEILNMSI
jgi:hypothetical protein